MHLMDTLSEDFRKRLSNVVNQHGLRTVARRAGIGVNTVARVGVGCPVRKSTGKVLTLAVEEFEKEQSANAA